MDCLGLMFLRIKFMLIFVGAERILSPSPLLMCLIALIYVRPSQVSVPPYWPLAGLTSPHLRQRGDHVGLETVEPGRHYRWFKRVEFQTSVNKQNCLYENISKIFWVEEIERMERKRQVWFQYLGKSLNAHHYVGIIFISKALH